LYYKIQLSRVTIFGFTFHGVLLCSKWLNYYVSLTEIWNRWLARFYFFFFFLLYEFIFFFFSNFSSQVPKHYSDQCGGIGVVQPHLGYSFDVFVGLNKIWSLQLLHYHSSIYKKYFYRNHVWFTSTGILKLKYSVKLNQ